MCIQEGDKDYDVVPNSCFVVSRTAFKDNSSYYKLNDRKATYREVATMLRGSGIDLDHNRFLILQVCVSIFYSYIGTVKFSAKLTTNQIEQ